MTVCAQARRVALVVVLNTLARTADAQVRGGVDRWPVKTWEDADAALVDTVPRAATVATLALIEIPEVSYPANARLAPVERTRYVVRAQIARLSTEDGLTSGAASICLVMTVYEGLTRLFRRQPELQVASLATPHEDEPVNASAPLHFAAESSKDGLAMSGYYVQSTAGRHTLAARALLVR